MAPENSDPPDKPSPTVASVEKTPESPGDGREQRKPRVTDNKVAIITAIIGFAVWFINTFDNEIRSLFGRVKSINKTGVEFYPAQKDEESPEGNSAPTDDPKP